MQFRGDAQIQVGVERVVMGDERTRQRAAGNPLEHGRLDLEEAARIEEAAQGAHHFRAHDEYLLNLFVGDEVEVALTIADLDIPQAVPLLGQGAEGLGEEGEVGHFHRHLARAGADQGSCRADQVAQIEVGRGAA